MRKDDLIEQLRKQRDAARATYERLLSRIGATADYDAAQTAAQVWQLMPVLGLSLEDVERDTGAASRKAVAAGAAKAHLALSPSLGPKSDEAVHRTLYIDPTNSGTAEDIDPAQFSFCRFAGQTDKALDGLIAIVAAKRSGADRPEEKLAVLEREGFRRASRPDRRYWDREPDCADAIAARCPLWRLLLAAARSDELARRGGGLPRRTNFLRAIGRGDLIAPIVTGMPANGPA
jgi:hypothetical protein